ncbi:MAG: thermonuclease family protein [Nitrospirae bacterium]|nr:thermonuclease family protein [Nitrospirota bacterium]
MSGRARGYLLTCWFVLCLTAFSWTAAAHAYAAGCEYFRVSRVIDGDTFVIGNGERVRLIGIDTPETVDPRADVEWFGKEAAKRLRELIEGKEVCLKRDRDRTIDRGKYNRLLRYAWIDGTFVNKELILQGYAFAYTRYPFQYMEEFRRYQETARRKGVGLWNSERRRRWEEAMREAAALAETCGRNGVICPGDARNFVGQTKTVRMFVRKAYDAGDRVFLNSENDYRVPENFTVMVMKPRGSSTLDIEDLFQGRVIDVRGRIRLYRGRAEITVRDLSRISAVQP